MKVLEPVETFLQAQIYMELGLSGHHNAHTSDARCVAGCSGLVASGGRDSLLKLWLQDGKAVVVQEEKWVNVVASIAPGRLKCCTDGGLVTGGQDGLIRIYSLEGQELQLQHTLQAHSAPVCSLSWLQRQGQLLLLSGGWDAVAKVWEVQSADASNCPATTLPGHENNVCVLGLANGDIITGSSGARDQAADRVAGFQLRIWRNAVVAQAIGEEDGGHTGAIRDLVAIPVAEGLSAFASASNDGTVAVWDVMQGNESASDALYGRLLTLAVPSASFVFSVCYLASSRRSTTDGISGTIFTADDMGDLCVFDLSRATSPRCCIRHPKTVWSVAVIAATEALQVEAPAFGDDVHEEQQYAVATACADGVVRIFTTDVASHLPAMKQKESLEPQPVDSPPRRVENYSMSTALPRASERGQFIGGEPGAISLFVDDEEVSSGANSSTKVVAFQWVDGSDVSCAGWVKLGQVLDPVPSQPSVVEVQQRQELDGELFDQIIPVEVDSASQGQLNLLLGVNTGDDPQSVAAKFCHKHGLTDEYIPQIAMFVESCL